MNVNAFFAFSTILFASGYFVSDNVQKRPNSALLKANAMTNADNLIKSLKGVGKQIRRIRQEKGLSLKDVAARMEQDNASVGRKERGVTRVHWDELATFADALGCTVDELLSLPVGNADVGEAKADSSDLIPVINRGPAGSVIDVEQVSVGGKYFEWIDPPQGSSGGDGTMFALEMPNDAMEPSIQKGDHLIFSRMPIDLLPQQEGKVVLAKIIRPGLRTIMGRMFFDGEDIRFAKDNARHPHFHCKKRDIIELAVAIEKRTKLP